VTNPKATQTDPWSIRYLGMVDYPAVIMWVLEQAEMAAAAFTAGNLNKCTSSHLLQFSFTPVTFAKRIGSCVSATDTARIYESR